MHLIYAKESFKRSGYRSAADSSIFLAGPTPREKDVKSWRPDAISYFERLNFSGTLIIPEPRDGDWSVCYDYQREWEQIGLDLATAVLFWVPRDLSRLPSGKLRLPGFTTNIEWGRCTMRYPHKLVLGFPASAPKMGYISEDARELGIPFEHDLRYLCHLALRLVEQQSR